MSIIICKSLLLLSIILALVSFFSTQWLNISSPDILSPNFKKYNTGLWYGCAVNEKSVKTCGQTEKILSDIMGVNDRGWILTRTFMISSIVFLLLAFILDFNPNINKKLIILFYILAIISIIATFYVFISLVEAYQLVLNPFTNAGNSLASWSFYLIQISLIIVIIAAICRIFAHK